VSTWWELARPTGALLLSVFLVYVLPLLVLSANAGATLAALMGLVFAWPVLFLFPIVLSFARRAKWRRPWADATIGAACALCMPTMMVAAGEVQLSASPIVNAASIAGIFALFAVAGALTCTLYWRLAGRPRPPYE
jgi:hypothetical protein